MEKLIRDNIQGVDYTKTRTARKEEIDTFLRMKLQEEIKELEESNFKDLNEYADILEVLYELARRAKFRPKDIEIARIIKLKERGGFTNKILTV
jgi:predicted house-cleaning noncanonical NTP pyrophosphatase (MazG superfamily)